MKTNDVVVLAGLAVAGVLLMNRAAAAKGVLPAGSLSRPAPTVNVNDGVWNALLGEGWKALKDASTSSGGPAFLMKNWLGQTVTSDGKPVGQEFMELAPTTYGLEIPVDTSFGGFDWEDKLFQFGEYF
jgi:hypothetical protein